MAGQKKDSMLREKYLKSEVNNKPFKAKFEVFGEEMIEKEVKQSGNSGRVYLPPEWVGRHVKIIRID
jgi:putative transposon-encoded protein